MRMEIINAQVPGQMNTTAKQRFNMYNDVKGLPAPYGKYAPMEPSVIGVNQAKYVKKPKPFEIVLWLFLLTISLTIKLFNK